MWRLGYLSLNTKCSCGKGWREGGGDEGREGECDDTGSQCQIGRLILRKEGWCMGVVAGGPQ